MNNLNFRIHPAIGIARVGNSTEYFLAPETAAGADTNAAQVSGGLPIKPGTETETITSSDLRDASGALKRQAARFRIFQYTPTLRPESYPLGPSACLQEIQIGSKVGDLTVADIVWTVHLANKKAAAFVADDENGVKSFEGKLPPMRNLTYGTDPNDPQRLKDLVIDPGPRTVSAKGQSESAFDRATPASWFDGQKVQSIANYPKTFPSDAFQNLYEPQGCIDSLGNLYTDAAGRLIVAGGFGKSAGWDQANNYPLNDAVNNDGWFDDAGDGPVSAALLMSDGSYLTVQGSAWVCATDPGFAPQIKNVVSAWEDIFDSWVRQLRLVPALYSNNAYNDDYQPGFYNHLSGVFAAAELQQWIANLPNGGRNSHNAVGNITPDTVPGPDVLDISIFRNPNDASQFFKFAAPNSPPYMPLSLGDSGQSMMSVTQTQYFFLNQWYNKKFTAEAPALGPGEALDQNTLLNCLGARFSPGIDVTFIVRLPDLYIQNWEGSGTGPFRINAVALDYSNIQPGQTFLTQGYIPLHGSKGIEPGDVLKQMALPWHTDYNSCANHPPDPGLNEQAPINQYTFWSWPAQRPVAVYPQQAQGVPAPQFPATRWFSVRGAGTDTTDETKVGRYQTIKDILTNWQKVGVVLQTLAIDDLDPSYRDAMHQNWYLEAESQFEPTPGSEFVKVPNWPKFLP